MTNLFAFLATFAFIFLKAFQQLNVVRGNYWWVFPVSMAMAVCEVFTISTIARNGWGWIVLSVGAGGAIGCVCAICSHKWLAARGAA